MRIPRTRGALSGLLLMILGAWAALIPLIGPYFSVEVGTTDTWVWSWGDFWLSILPGAVAFAGGLLLLLSAVRSTAMLGAALATAAGAWLVIGPTVSMLWNDGTSAGGAPLGSDERQVVELLVTSYGVGALILAFGAFALGRVARRAAPVTPAERARGAAAVPPAERGRTTEPAPSSTRVGRFAREPAASPRERAATGAPLATAPAEPAPPRDRGGVEHGGEMPPGRFERTAAAPPPAGPGPTAPPGRYDRGATAPPTTGPDPTARPTSETPGTTPSPTTGTGPTAPPASPAPGTTPPPTQTRRRGGLLGRLRARSGR